MCVCVCVHIPIKSYARTLEFGTDEILILKYIAFSSFIEENLERPWKHAIVSPEICSVACSSDFLASTEAVGTLYSTDFFSSTRERG